MSRDDPVLFSDTVKQQAETWLARLRAGRPADQAEFEDWYSADPTHAAAYDRLLASWARTEVLIGDMPVREVAPLRRQLPAIAAAVLVLVGVGWAALQQIGRSPAGVEQRASTSETGRRYVLSDGSRLDLGPNTFMQSRLSEAERYVRLLRGRARFAVAHDRRRTFVVETVAGTITGTGAEFDIAVEADRATIALYNGSLAIRCLDCGVGALMLEAGKRVTISRGGPATRPMPIASGVVDVTMLSFENARLSEVVAAVNRAGGAAIVLADPIGQDLRFTGTLRTGDAAGIARLLSQTFHLRLREDRTGRRYILD